MDPAREIVKLCEDWWKDTPSDSAEKMHVCAGKFFEYLGWQETKDFDSAFLDFSAYVEAPDGISLVLYFTPADTLLAPSEVIGKGLDFCNNTRWRVEEAREHHFDYAFITDLYRSYLYDVDSDELLLSCDSPSVFLIEIYDEITRECVVDGSLRELRRNPRSALAKQLRQWLQGWSDTIALQPGSSETVADALFDRLVVLRYLAEREQDRKGGSGLRNRITMLGAQARDNNPTRLGKEIERLFMGLHSARRMALFEATPAMKALVENDEMMTRMLIEFALISKSKFSIPVVLESFNYGEAAEKARVRLAPGGDGRREDLIASQTLERIDNFKLEIDIVEEGYRAIGYWLEKLIALYRRLGNKVEVAQLSEEDSGERMPRAIRDMHRHAVESGLCVFHNSPRQYRTARLMLYLYTIKAYSDSGEAFAHFPNIEAALAERPVFLESEKGWKSHV